MADYIPSDNPDLIKRHEKRIKAKEKAKKITDFFSPVLTKKFKKRLREEEISEKPKLSTTKSMLANKINRKAKKTTETEGSFRRGGLALRGYGKAYMKGGKVK